MKLAVGVVLLAGLALVTPASAADLGATPESDAFSWTGGYIGINTGYSWGHSASAYDNAELAAFAPLDSDPAGWLGGLTAGINQEVGGGLVVGIEGNVDYGDVTSTIPDIAATLPPTPLYGQTITSRTDWSGTLRGRVGFAAGKLLPYLTAGLSVANVTVSATDGPLSESAILTGWTAGGGVEFALDEHWSANAEYLYTSFGSHTWFASDPWASTSTSTSSTVMGGINYRF